MEGKVCPECRNGQMIIRDEWDKAFDRLDNNIPAGDIIHAMLKKDGIHKYGCTNCDYKQMSN